ncbi:MAG: Nramp family divalent metal transporter [Actinophytocola sp.]|uniref:Nramp family divalent metal transporter n=1 Tax=Actinophytocola sp. TaxID=1872138 RepID=UPI003C72F088
MTQPASVQQRPEGDASTRRRIATTLPMLGPAFVAAVAYIDPGNVAMNVTAGASFGYRLLWVVLAANLTAMLVQYLSAKVGLATGRTLPELCRDRYRTGVRLGLWFQAEIVVIMTDIAEVVGAAVALNLLFGIPIAAGGALSAACMVTVLAVHSRRRRMFEAVVCGFLLIVLLAVCYQVIAAGLDMPAVAGGLVPSLAGPYSVAVAVGIIGATVMPHAIYLHSALTASLAPGSGIEERRAALRGTRLDVLIALSVAAVVNTSMLVSATVLRHEGELSLSEAYTRFGEVLGPAIATVFAVALLASALVASSVGVYAGQVVMAGLLRRTTPLWLRRAVSIVPAVVVLALGWSPMDALLVSQIVLSFGVPFVLVPLLRLTADREVMGELVNRRGTTVVAWVAAALIIGLNAVLLGQQLAG